MLTANACQHNHVYKRHEKVVTEYCNCTGRNHWCCISQTGICSQFSFMISYVIVYSTALSVLYNIVSVQSINTCKGFIVVIIFICSPPPQTLPQITFICQNEFVRNCFPFRTLATGEFEPVRRTRGILLAHSFSLTTLCILLFSRRSLKLIPSQKEDE